MMKKIYINSVYSGLTRFTLHMMNLFYSFLFFDSCFVIGFVSKKLNFVLFLFQQSSCTVVVDPNIFSHNNSHMVVN